MNIEEQRENAVKQLEFNYAHGHIDLDELEKRLEMAVHTSLAEDLERITSDLKPVTTTSSDANSDTVNSGDIRPDETFMGILSSINRKGRWKPARENNLYAFMGGINLDFSEALLAPGETDFEFFCVMGGIEIIVPLGINVEVNGLPIMGGIDNHLPGDHYPGQPTIRFHGTVIMGGMDIKLPKRQRRRRKK